MNLDATLQRVFDRAATLPEDEQKQLADWLTAELDDGRHWQKQFATNPSMLQAMADAALEEDLRGETRPWPNPDR